MKEFDRPICSHPQAGPHACAGPIVKAHTVRRATDLNSIADHGHVMQFQADMRILTRTKGQPEARKIGIKQASTFLGFCGQHDGATFRPLEGTTFVGTAEQCFLLLYRAWCREAYAKEAAGRGVSLLREADKGRSLSDQVAIQRQVSAHILGVELGVRDVRHYKAIADRALLEANFSVIQSRVFKFDGQLPVVCSGAFYPYFDISGNRLQDFDPRVTPQPITITLLNEGGVGFGVLSWVAGATAPRAFAEAVSNHARVSNAMCAVALIGLENTFMAPKWWSNLSGEQRANIVRRFSDNLDPFVDIRAGDLAPFEPPVLTLKLDEQFAV